MKTILCFITVILTFTTLAFVPNSFARDALHRVRVVYFLPRHSKSQSDIDAKMDEMIKTIQKFYADQMEQHEFGRKTFPIETGANEKTVVHLVNGKFNEAYYVDIGFLYEEAWNEVREHFDTSQDIYFLVIETNSFFLQYGTKVNPKSEEFYRPVGVARNEGNWGGLVAMSRKAFVGNSGLVAHELGHTFGLDHDFRELGHARVSILGGDEAFLHSNIMTLGPWYTRTLRLSKCAAESLDVHRYFNASWQNQDFSNNTIVQMIPPTLVSPSNAVRFRFKITDPDGLHQVQLLGNVRGWRSQFNRL